MLGAGPVRVKAATAPLIHAAARLRKGHAREGLRTLALRGRLGRARIREMRHAAVLVPLLLHLIIASPALAQEVTDPATVPGAARPADAADRARLAPDASLSVASEPSDAVVY